MSDPNPAGARGPVPSWGPVPGGHPGPYPPPYVAPHPGPAALPAPPYGAGRLPYASWGRRVGAYVIDFLPSLIGTVFLIVSYLLVLVDLARAEATASFPDLSRALVPGIIGLVFQLVALGWQIYSRWVLGGRTGQSVGKRMFKITLVSQDTGRPIGVFNAFARDLLHIVDGMAYVGYLWPLWDEQRQTFADKIARTVVLDRPDAPASQAA